MKKFLFLFLSAFLLAGCNRVDNHQPLGSQKAELALTQSFSQSFVSHRDNLNIVYICLRNPARLLTPLRFTLNDSLDNPLRTLDFNGGNIDNSDCTRFQFEPILDSQNQVYVARIAPNLDPHLIAKQVEAAIGSIYVESDSGVLHYKTLYQQDLRSVLTESFAQFYARLGLDSWFMLPYLILLALTVYFWHRAHD